MQAEGGDFFACFFFVFASRVSRVPHLCCWLHILAMITDFGTRFGRAKALFVPAKVEPQHGPVNFPFQHLHAAQPHDHDKV